MRRLVEAASRVARLKYGDLEDGEIYVGAGAGVTGSVIRCADVVRRTIDEASTDGLIGLAAAHAG